MKINDVINSKLKTNTSMTNEFNSNNNFIMKKVLRMISNLNFTSRNIFPDNIVSLTIYQVYNLKTARSITLEFLNLTIYILSLQTKTIRTWPYYPEKNVTEAVKTNLESTDMIGRPKHSLSILKEI